MAQALKNLGEGGKVYAYDLFEEYKYRNFSKTEVWNNVNKYEVQDHVQLKRKSFDRWLNTSEDFDLLHLDISNDGDIVLKMHDRGAVKAIPSRCIKRFFLNSLLFNIITN